MTTTTEAAHRSGTRFGVFAHSPSGTYPARRALSVHVSEDAAEAWISDNIGDASVGNGRALIVESIPAGDQLTTTTTTVPATVPAVPMGVTMSDATTATVPAVDAAAESLPSGRLSVTVPRDALAAALAYVVKGNGRPSVPILSGIVLTVAGDVLTVHTFDWDTLRSVDLVAAGGSVAGRDVVAGKPLTDYVKKLPKSVDLVDLVAAGTTLTVAAGGASASFDTMPVEDLPAVPAMPHRIGSVDASALAGMVAHVKPAAGTDETLPALCAVYVRTDAGRITMDTTDRYRLHSVAGTWSPAEESPGHLVAPGSAYSVPAKPMAEFAALVGKRAGKRSVSVDVHAERVRIGDQVAGDMYALTVDGWTFATRTYDGGFPAVDGLWPDVNAYRGTVTVAAGDLVDLVARVTAGAGKKEKIPVILVPAGDTLTAEYGQRADESGPAARASMPATVNGAVTHIGFNPAYLVAALATFGKSTRVTLSLVDPYKPAVVTAESVPDARCLLMPIRVTRSDVAAAVPAAVPAAEAAVPAVADQVDQVDAPDAVPAAEAVGDHAYVGTDKRCALAACDKGRAAMVHRAARVAARTATAARMAAGEPAAPATTAPAAEAVDQVDALTVRDNRERYSRERLPREAVTVPAGIVWRCSAFSHQGDAPAVAVTTDGHAEAHALADGRKCPMSGYALPAESLSLLIGAHRDRIAAEAAAPAVADQVDQVDAPDAVPAAEAAGDQVDSDALAAEVRRLIAAGTYSIETVAVGRGRDRSRHTSTVLRLPAGKLSRDVYTAVRDTVSRVAGGGWNRDARGFTLPAAHSATGPWDRSTPSGRERIATWLAAGDAAGDQVDQVATVPAGEAASVPAVPVDQVDTRRALADGRSLSLVAGIVPDVMPAPVLPAGALAAVADADMRPATFDPYREQIRDCACAVCTELAFKSHHWVADRDRVAAARVLLAHLVAGTHQHVTHADRIAYAKTAHAARVAAAEDAGMTGEALDRVRHPDVYMRLDARAAVRDSFVNGSGLGIGNAPIRAEAAARRAAEAAGDQVDQVDTTAPATVPAEPTGDTMPETTTAPAVTVAPADFAPYRAEIAGCTDALCTALAAGARSGDVQPAARALLAALVAGTHQRPAPAAEAVTYPYAGVWSETLTPGAGRMINRPGRVHVRTQPVTVLGPVNFEPGMVRVRTAAGEVHRAMRADVKPAEAAAEATTAPAVPVDQVDAPAGEAAAEAAGDACPDCGEHISDPHAPGCPSDPDPVTLPDALADAGPVRIVVPDALAAPATVPAVAVDQVDTVPALAGGLHGAHVQNVHVSGRGPVDGYRFHLVAGARTRAVGKDVRAALGNARRVLGASFTVTAPAKSRTVNVVPAPGCTVRDWPAALAVVAETIGAALAAGSECAACDRSHALAESE